jgi:hypothetical protein
MFLYYTLLSGEPDPTFSVSFYPGSARVALGS